MGLSWVSRIDFILPSMYQNDTNNPRRIKYGTIPGDLVLECPMPMQSIKSDDDFFSDDSQRIPIKIRYDQSRIEDVLFFQLTEANFPIGLEGVARYTDELDGCIVKIYNRYDECVFDGILCVDGKSFDTADFTISFKVYDIMRAYKERSSLPAYQINTIDTPIGFLNINKEEFAFYIREVFKEFRAASGYSNLNPWEDSPITLINNAPKMGFGEFTGQELASINVSKISQAKYYFGTNNTIVGVSSFFIYQNDDTTWSIVRFWITNPYSIVASYYSITPYASLQDCINMLQSNGFAITETNAYSYNGVSYAMEYIQAAPQRVRLKAYTGGWQVSNLAIKPETTLGQVVKLFLLVCGWKMSIKRNVITIAQNCYGSISAVTAIQPSTSQIQNFRTNTILPYDKLGSDIFSIINEPEETVKAIKSAVENKYNNYLPRITKEVEFNVHGSSGIPEPGSFVATPIVPGVPNFGTQAGNRTYFVYEVEQNQDDTDWYNCRAYNIFGDYQTPPIPPELPPVIPILTVVGKTVVISHPDPTVQLYYKVQYTLPITAPDIDSDRYNLPLPISFQNEHMYVKAIAYKNKMYSPVAYLALSESHEMPEDCISYLAEYLADPWEFSDAVMYLGHYLTNAPIMPEDVIVYAAEQYFPITPTITKIGNLIMME